MEVGGHLKTGRSKLRWSDVIRKDMKEKGVKIEEAQERRMWRLKTRRADPKGQRRRRFVVDHCLQFWPRNES